LLFFYKDAKEKYFSDSRGALSLNGARAEIIPVEPDQGNACAGKVAIIQSSSLRGQSHIRFFGDKWDKNEKNDFGSLPYQSFAYSSPGCYTGAGNRFGNW
jgi:hypothetical protein